MPPALDLFGQDFIGHDLRYAIRGLIRNPAYALTTILAAGGWTAVGVLLGIAGSLSAARVLRSLLFQVAPGDPVSIAAAGAVLCAVALAAAAIPARRAARVDPNVALRQE